MRRADYNEIWEMSFLINVLSIFENTLSSLKVDQLNNLFKGI